MYPESAITVIETIAVKQDGAEKLQGSHMMLGPMTSGQRGGMLELSQRGPGEVRHAMAWEGPTLSLASHLALWLGINFPKPQFSHLEDGTNDNVGMRESHLRELAEQETALHLFYQYLLSTS